jgi:hypothetical protein
VHSFGARAANPGAKGAFMHMKAKDRWHCTNPACQCEVLVANSALEDGNNPRCSCGAAMKKIYVSPVLTYLEFLKLEQTPEGAAREDLDRAR